jgi:hypothetical protein
MLNEKLIYRAHGMLLDRVNYYDKQAKEAKSHSVKVSAISSASAYKSAYDILWYAINNNEECLKEFDYYAD